MRHGGTTKEEEKEEEEAGRTGSRYKGRES